MTATECEYGCDCAQPMQFREFATVLEPSEVDRLIEEKMARAQRYIRLQEKVQSQLID